MASAAQYSSPQTRFPARAALRGATAAAHARVDAGFGGFALDSLAGYSRFLQAQAAAFLPVEAALDRARAEETIPDWPQRRRAALLRSDLADLAVTASALPEPELATPAEIAGAVYVIEGSRLGGAMLVRGVSPDLPTRFLSAPQGAGAWRALLDRLDHLFFDDNASIEEAIHAAGRVFALFERAAEQAVG